ncbi:AbrB family transcriptional regulator [Frigidibacter sp. MR17.14]|uniref:AbrB family transcriptional regulator n=1 Tax=Frigidibacter sp. MR17.14 TaxID=3126509 RepID=UPI003012B8BE
MIPSIPRDPSRLGQWALMLAGGLLLGLGLERLHVPAALMLGPILMGATLALRGVAIRVGRIPHQFGQAIAGTLIALNLDPSVLGQTLQLWPVVIFFVVVTLALACVTGLVAARLTRLDQEVAVWGFMPGMAGTMIAMAHDRGIDSRMVAFIQILRLLMVIGTMIAVGAALVGAAQPHGAGAPAADAASTALVLGLGLLGIAAARYLPMLPAGATLVPLVLACLLWVNGVNIAIPHWLVALGYLFIGAQAGLRFTPDLLRTGARALPMLVVSVLLLLGLCALSGVLLSLVAGVDLMSAMLATVPGSIDSIALIAISTGSDISFIMALQTVRLFAVVLLGPPLARAVLHLCDRSVAAARRG